MGYSYEQTPQKPYDMVLYWLIFLFIVGFFISVHENGKKAPNENPVYVSSDTVKNK